jgi:type 1 glutamine amidotransferase
MQFWPLWTWLRTAAPAVMLAMSVALPWVPAGAQDRPVRILYFTHSAGYRHEVIPASREILKRIGETPPRFEVTASDDVSVFTAENLRRYGAVMFFTSGELPMSGRHKQVLTDFVRDGGGFLAVHSATDTFYQWPEYGRLIGGYFDQHPWHQEVRIIADRFDPLVSFIGPSLVIVDEIYQIRDFAAGSHVVLRLDPSSVDLTREHVRHHPWGWPLAWTRSYGNGRVFYTALGHDESVWRDTRFQTLLRNAVIWTTNAAPAVP